MNSAINRCYSLVVLGLLVFRADAMDPNDINIFFPEINGNLTKVTWAHAVNNKTLLASALNSAVMMLEADVIYGRINGSGPSMPIMGHPPAVESDLSLEDFLTTTFKFNADEKNRAVRKGVKLDFKSTDAFQKSVPIIEQLYDSIDYPIWINADIISGPTDPTTVPVNAAKFLSASKVFTKSVLSLGWTTTKPTKDSTYTSDQINNMTAALRNGDVKQNVTFAVRAGTAAQSLDQMRVLKEGVNGSTLTIWSSEGDDVDVLKLKLLIFGYGIDRVFIDVPKDLYDRLDLGSSASKIQAAFVALSIAVAALMSLF